MSLHMIPVESMLDIIFPYDICIRFVSKMDNFILIIFFQKKGNGMEMTYLNLGLSFTENLIKQRNFVFKSCLPISLPRFLNLFFPFFNINSLSY